MARFYGEVGYGTTEEQPAASGVWVDVMIEEPYFGDVIRNIKRAEAGEGLNTDIAVNNAISIVASPYAIGHYFEIKYVRWEGVLWTVTAVEVRLPRLILNLGSVYNGPTL
jgi:hypothetical protein